MIQILDCRRHERLCLGAARVIVAAFVLAAAGVLAAADPAAKSGDGTKPPPSTSFAGQWAAAEQIVKLHGIVQPDDGSSNVPVSAVDLAHCRLTANDLKLLKPLVAIKALSLADTSLSDNSWDELPVFDKLASLDLSFNPSISSRAIERIAKLSNLKIVHLEGTAISDQDVARLKALRPKLEITSNDQKLLPALARDEALDRLRDEAAAGRLHFLGSTAGLDGVVGRLDDDQLRLLTPIKELTRAFLNGSLIHGHGLRYLANNNRLWRLELFHCPLVEDELAPLAEMNQLLLLNVWGTDFGDKAMQHVGKLSRLQNLCLDETKVTDEGLKQLAHLPHISMLRLRGDRITDVGVQRIGDLTELQILDLRETQITDASISTLGKMSTLTDLDVTGSRITAAGLEKLKQAMPQTEILGRTAADDRSEARFAIKAKGGPIDLLSATDPSTPPAGRLAVYGKWIKTRGELLSATTAPAWYQSAEPPLEYDLAITLDRVLGTDSVNIALPVGAGCVIACLDADQGTANWIEGVGGKQYWGGEGTRWRPHLLTRGKSHELLFQVRDSGVQISCDGNPIIHWVGDSKRLAPFDNWPLPNRKAIYVGSWNTVFRFKKIELKPLLADQDAPAPVKP